MRLALKITLVILLGTTLLLLIYSYQSFRRETNVLKSNLSREARQVGQVLRSMVVEIWQLQGQDAAQSFLRQAGSLDSDQLVRWVWLDAAQGSPTGPRVSGEKLAPARKGKTVTLIAETENGRDFLFTYLPMKTPTGRVGAIEIGESLAGLHGYVRESMTRSALLLGAIVLSSLLLIFLVGSFWVSRPVKQLAEQAERIASGDFSETLELRGRDEFAALATALDRMRGRLADARQSDQARLEALEKLRHTERLATIGRLSAGMAHELGTPLNVIAGRAKLIAGQSLPPEEVGRSARIINEQAERMTAIMRQLLDFARRGSLRTAPVNLERLAGSVQEMLLPAAQKQGVSITLASSTEPLEVVADSAQLQQVLLNLVMNGIQAMPDGGTLEICLKGQNGISPPEGIEPGSGHWAVIAVRDSGVGIPDEDLPHLFDPFFTTKDIGQGTGLGLAIAYGIVQEHGGWIEVDSRSGQGSTFRVNLPLATSREEANDA
jgi:two-component system NtrC family sensor kinase